MFTVYVTPAGTMDLKALATYTDLETARASARMTIRSDSFRAYAMIENEHDGVLSMLVAHDDGTVTEKIVSH